MTKREQRVVTAFVNCIRHGEYTVDYAITLIEDNARYGWLSEAAKEAFYAELDKLHPELEEVDQETMEEPETTEDGANE